MLRKSLGLAVAALFIAGAAFTANADDKKKPKLTEVTVCPVSGHPGFPNSNPKQPSGGYPDHRQLCLLFGAIRQ